jgi:hypothetical protein
MEVKGWLHEQSATWVSETGPDAVEYRKVSCLSQESILQLSSHSLITILTEISQLLPPLFFLILWGGMGLSPLGTSATNGPTVPATDGR